VRMLGHVGEEEKLRLLSEAWVAINTSIHEALAVSLQEALACETPLLSCIDTGFIVSRHGIYTGRFDGDGMASLGAFGEGLQSLLDNPERRRQLGRRGRGGVRATHTLPGFLDVFFSLCRRAGIER